MLQMAITQEYAGQEDDATEMVRADRQGISRFAGGEEGGRRRRASTRSEKRSN